MELEFCAIEGLDAADFGRAGTSLLSAMAADAGARPRLVIVELQGESTLLGRHQRAASALGPGARAARRAGGGRAAVAGEGRIGVLLGLPAPGALLDGPVGADRVINRYVRGLLAGLTSLGAGAGAHYFGRDFVSAEGKQLALVSQDGEGAAALFEAVVGVREPAPLAASRLAYPAHGDPRAHGPEPTTLEALGARRRPFDELARAIADGYARMYGCSIVPVDAGAPAGPDPEPPVVEDEAGFEESGVADVPIGFVEALVRRDGERVAEARLRGDFVAPAFAVRSLEASLRGCPLSFDEVGRRVDAAFRLPGATVLGVRSLRIFAEAILAAAGEPT